MSGYGAEQTLRLIQTMPAFGVKLTGFRNDHQIAAALVLGKCAEDSSLRIRLRAIAVRYEFSPRAVATLQLGPCIMSSLDLGEKRQSPRRRLGRLATIKLGVGIAPRFCLVSNASAEGVRLQLNGIEI